MKTSKRDNPVQHLGLDHAGPVWFRWVESPLMRPGLLQGAGFKVLPQKDPRGALHNQSELKYLSRDYLLPKPPKKGVEQNLASKIEIRLSFSEMLDSLRELN